MTKAEGARLVGVDPVTGRVLETAEARAQGLAELRTLIMAAEHSGKVAKVVRKDDRFLLAFLRARKYDVGAACEVLLNFNAFWYKWGHLIEGLNADSAVKFASMNMIRWCDSKDCHGNSVFALYMGAFDATKFNAEDQLRYIVYTMALCFEDDAMQLHGVTYVETLKGFSWARMMGARALLDTPEHKELMNLPMDVFPMRIRHIYCTDQPWYFSLFWKLVKPFLKTKMTKRLALFGKDYEALHELVPKDALPPEFGGTNMVPFEHLLDKMRAMEKDGIGGFKFPLSVNDPCGLNAAAAVTASAAAAGSVE